MRERLRRKTARGAPGGAPPAGTGQKTPPGARRGLAPGTLGRKPRAPGARRKTTHAAPSEEEHARHPWPEAARGAPAPGNLAGPHRPGRTVRSLISASLGRSRAVRIVVATDSGSIHLAGSYSLPSCWWTLACMGLAVRPG